MIAMNDVVSLLLALLAGILLGGMFFCGLWWTIQKGISSNRPALWFFISLVLRTGIALAGFYFVGRGRLEYLIPCVLGFMISRLIVNRLVQEVRHAH